MRLGVVAAAALVVAAAAAPSASAKVEQLVVFRTGSANQTAVAPSAATVKVGRKRCTVGGGTALAALVHSHVGKLVLKDFGSCSRRAVDAGQLYVRAIGRDRASGVNGWVYKVGNKLATGGAGDPAGPFGNGRLKAGTRVTWFYCRMTGRSCQRTLVVTPQVLGPGSIRVTVSADDDNGHAAPDAGATVHAGSASAQTGADGTAVLSVPSGTVRVYAEHAGEVRSFEEAVQVP